MDKITSIETKPCRFGHKYHTEVHITDDTGTRQVIGNCDGCFNTEKLAKYIAKYCDNNYTDCQEDDDWDDDDQLDNSVETGRRFVVIRGHYDKDGLFRADERTTFVNCENAIMALFGQLEQINPVGLAVLQETNDITLMGFTWSTVLRESHQINTLHIKIEDDY